MQAIADAMDNSRMGGATMKMPPSSFSQRGLASMFGIELDDDTNSPPIAARKRTGIVAGTVCGIVGLAVLVLLGGYMAWRWRKMHAHVEDPVYEKDVHPDVHVGHPEVREGAVEEGEAQSNSIRTQSGPDGFF